MLIELTTNIMTSYKTSTKKRALNRENNRIFQCKYCPRTFSRHEAFRNHLQMHKDQMYLNENEPVCEKNISEPKRTNIGNTLQRTALSPVLFNDIINPYKEQTWDINEECEKQ